MARTKSATKPIGDDLAVVERLVNEGKLIAVPPRGAAKPRRVAAAALHDDGELLLYLSRATTSIVGDDKPHEDGARPPRSRNRRQRRA